MLDLSVEIMTLGPVSTNCYIVENCAEKSVVVIDPSWDAERIIKQIGERQCKGVLLTHAHFDHIGALDDICNHYKVDAYIHVNDAAKLSDPVLNASTQFGYNVVQTIKPITFQDKDVIELAGIPFEVMHTPGHSSGSVCFILPDNLGIFCGDTLFNGGYGRTDIGDGDFMQLKQSLRKLMFHTPRVPAFPGHGEMTYAGKEEKKG